MVHRMRHQLSAVMVGVNTVVTDDPLLNIRLKGQWKNPLKIIADSHGRIPLEAKVLTNDPQLTIVATTNLADKEKLKAIERMGSQVLVCPAKKGQVDLVHLMHMLGAMEIGSVMIEGGGTIAFSALQEGIIDKVVCFIAPKILGGANAPTPVGGEGIAKMEEALNLREMRTTKIGEDIMVEGWL